MVPFFPFMFFWKIKKNPFDYLQIKSFFFSCKPPGSSVDPFKTSELLSSYFKWGKIREAQKLFDEMTDKNIVSWSIVIHGYAINGFHSKSIELFSQMRILSLVPNSFTVVGVLVCARGLQDLVLGKSIHGLTVKSGFESDSVVGTALLGVYAKCGNIFDSCKLFEGMKNTSLVSCNAMLAGYIDNELFEEGVLVFNQLRMSGFIPNESTMLTIVRGFVALESILVTQSIHGLLVKLGLNFHMSVNNLILDMYSCFMDVDAAKKVFDMMEYKDVISWTTMMGLLVNLEYAGDALNLFIIMRASKVNHDAVVIMNLVLACTVLGDLKKGRQIHSQAVICGLESDLPLANSLITMYSKHGELQSSRAIFNQMTRKSLVSWTAMISGYLQNGHPREAMDLFMEVWISENYFLDSAIVINAFTASGEVAAFELCQQLHCYSIKAGFNRYRSVQNSVISAYSNCGNIDIAQSVFEEMGCLRDRVSWNAIINGYGINGQGEAALAVYHKMRKGREHADSFTYSCILGACSHSGLIMDGLMVFNQMVKENKIMPSQEHYGCVVGLLARAGCLAEASGLVDDCFEVMGPNALRNLLSGCVLHGNVELAEVVAKKLFEQDPKEAGHVVLLSNVYASVGRFQNAETLRTRMDEQGLIKNQGISSLSENSYDFG